MEAGLIKVEPEPVNIGPNSIDLRMGNTLKQYDRAGFVRLERGTGTTAVIDPKTPPKLAEMPLERMFNRKTNRWTEGWILTPGEFYIGTTLEKTTCRGVVPHLDGRSTCGRLGIEAHKTAGVGDNGFSGFWTLEIQVAEPIILRPGDRLFQVYFTPCWSTAFAEILIQQEAGTLNEAALQRLLHGELALLETEDLYAQDGRGHYSADNAARAAAPLD
jgi:dCTP deaminase